MPPSHGSSVEQRQSDDMKEHHHVDEKETQQIISFQEKINKLEAQLNRVTTEKDRLEIQQQDLFAIVAMNNSLKQELEAERTAHKLSSQQSEYQIKSLRDKVQYLSDNKADLDEKEKKEALLNRTHELEEEITRLRAALNETMRPSEMDNDDGETMSQLRARVVEWELQYKTDATTIASLKEQVAELSQELKEVKLNQSTAKTNEVAMLYEKIQHTEATHQEDVELINCLQQQIADSAAKEKEMQHNICELQKQIKESRVVANESSNIQQYLLKIEQLEQRLSMATLEKDSLLALLSNAEAERDKLQETNEELAEKLSVEVNTVKSYYEGNITTLEYEKQQLEREILQLRNEINALKDRATNAERDINHDTEIVALREEITRLKESSLTQANTANTSCEIVISQETARIAELEETVSKLKRKLEQQKETSAEEYASLAETLLLTENDFNNVQQELMTVKQQTADIYRERNQLREEVRVLQQACKGSDDQQAIVEELIAAKMQIAASAMEHDELQKKIQNYKRKVQNYAERIATMEVAAAEKGNGKDTKINNAKEKMKKIFRKSESKS